jgi:hypothetical protein
LREHTASAQRTWAESSGVWLVPEFMEAGGPIRVTGIRSFCQCPLAAKWQAESDWSNVPMDQGTIGHRVAEEIVSTLQRQGESRMPTQEAVEVLREVYAEMGVPLPAKELRDLRLMILNFCEIEWPVRRIMAIEERLFADVACPDGVTRTLTGRPDILVADPPDGITAVDLKFGYRRPPQPREDTAEAWDADGGKRYLSPEGLLQLSLYGLLIMRNFPAVGRVNLREQHVRWGEHRRATLTREELEHVEYEVGAHLMMFDKALAEGDESATWKPRPGAHCSYCPRPLDCPIPPQERGEGAVHDEASMQVYAEAYVPTKAQKDHLEKAIKNGLAEGIPPARVGDRDVGWSSEDKGRRFGLVKP